MPKVYLVNVGVNASHTLKSPLFPDGRFELVPIPERINQPGPPMRRYGDIPSKSGQVGGLLPYLPSSYHDRYCHFDPEFVTCTYGDDPGRTPRAAALRSAQPGDWLLFLARLWDWLGGHWTGQSSFYFVAALEIASALKDVRGALPEQDLHTYGDNAHVLRAQIDSSMWNGFWVLKGNARSHLFTQAIELTAGLAGQLLRDKSGQPWIWRDDRTPLQTIGSYTRTIRSVADTESEAFSAWPRALRQELA